MNSRRPNIVMILTDDHGSQSISAYGSVINSTPRIDEIASSGVRFENCFVTNTSCSADPGTACPWQRRQEYE